MTVAPSNTVSTKQSVVPGVIVILIGLGLLCIALARLQLNRMYERDGGDVIGTVIGTGASSSSSRYIRYEFATPDGRHFVGTQTGYSGRAGEKIRLQYLGNRPSWNRVSGSERRDRGSLLPLGIFGGLLAMAGAYSVVRVLRSMSPRSSG